MSRVDSSPLFYYIIIYSLNLQGISTKESNGNYVGIFIGHKRRIGALEFEIIKYDKDQNTQIFSKWTRSSKQDQG